jgi:hypothetical protein
MKVTISHSKKVITADERKVIKKAIKNLSNTASNGAAPTEKTIAREEVLEELIVGIIEDRDKEITSLRRALSILKNEVGESAYETPEMVELKRSHYDKMNAFYAEYRQAETDRELKESEAQREFEDEMKRLKTKAMLQIAEDAGA